MNLDFSVEQQDFREEVRTWLAEHKPAERRPDDAAGIRAYDLGWQRTQYKGGWAGIAWPREYGGRGLSLLEQLIWYEEYGRAGLPSLDSTFVGLNHAGPTLIEWANQAQKAAHLLPILRGDVVWCQGFSEPEAGSDLASLRTRARIDGDELVVSGQKIWTSSANLADWQELLVRTDTTVPKHQGITWVICDMRAPGIDARPIETMDREHDFCEVFYDDVRIPVSNVVGELNQGWRVAMSTLSFERGTAFTAGQVRLASTVENLIAVAAERPGPLGRGTALADEELARRLATLRAEVAALRAVTYSVISRSARQGTPGPEGSIVKLYFSELQQQVARLSMDLLGPDSLRFRSRWDPGGWTGDYLHSFASTIGGGTSEIQRNIIGERVLGLPRLCGSRARKARMDLYSDAEPFSLADVDVPGVLLDAELPSLLPALAQLTGDMSLVRPGFRPAVKATPLGLEPQGGLSPQAQQRARDAAARAIRDWVDRGRPAAPALDSARLRDLMGFITGEAGDDYLPLFRHQLGIEDAPQPAPDAAGFSVVVIGAGMSGLAAAYRLRQAGISFRVIERNPEVGGVWWENSYPGCRLDTSNFSYSYSFAQQPTWQYQYSTRESIVDYFRRAADELNLRGTITFGTEVTSATFDERTRRWRLRTAGNAAETIEADAVISAVGQLNKPRYPDIPGRARFAGISWHTARWNHDVDLSGKRVAVVGTGASSFQVVPEIAPEAAQLTLFQRNPPWIMPTPAYHSLLKPGLRWLFRHVPGYHRWFRFYQFWVNVEGRRQFALVDPDWTHDVSVSAKNEALRQGLVAHLEKGYADRPDLLAGAVPGYPPYAKRMLRDDGRWFETLKRENVTVVTEPIAEIVEEGVVTGDGTVHEVDVIVYGTGFLASEFLSPMRVAGRGGVDLHEQWNDDARAYLGITMPNFPNFFLLYGPNTNLVVNGSIVMFSELEVDYVLACLRTLLDSPHRTMECRWDALEKYYQRVDAASAMMAWGTPKVHSWYKNASGRVTQNWPLSTLEFWERTRGPVLADYDFG